MYLKKLFTLIAIVVMNASAFAQTDYNPFLKVVANSEVQYKSLLSDLLVNGNGEKWHAGAGQAYFEFFNHIFPGESPENIIAGTKFVSASTLKGDYQLGMLHKKTREFDWWERPWRTGERIGVYKGIAWTSMACGNPVAVDIPLVEPNDYTKKTSQVAQSVSVVEKVVEVPVMAEKVKVVEKVVEVPVVSERVEYVPYPVYSQTPQPQLNPQPYYPNSGYDPYYEDPYYGYGGGGYYPQRGITFDRVIEVGHLAAALWNAHSNSRTARAIEGGAMRSSGGDVYVNVNNSNTNTNTNNSYNRGGNRQPSQPRYDNTWPDQPGQPGNGNDGDFQGPKREYPRNTPSNPSTPSNPNYDNQWAVDRSGRSNQVVSTTSARMQSSSRVGSERFISNSPQRSMSVNGSLRSVGTRFAPSSSQRNSGAQMSAPRGGGRSAVSTGIRSSSGRGRL